MTQLTNLMMFLIAMKFQFIQTQFLDKDDYFNHKEYDLPEFLVDESLFTTEKKDLLRNPPWITEEATTITSAAKSANKVKTATKSTTSVTATFETKQKRVPLPQPTREAMRSNNYNETNLILPFWSRFSHAPFINSTTELPSTTRSTISYTISLTPQLITKPTTTPPSTTRSTISYTISLTPKLITKPTTTPPSTTRSTISYRISLTPKLITKPTTTPPSTTRSTISYTISLTPKLITKPTTTPPSTTKSTISYTISLTPKLTTKPTTRSTPKPTTKSTATSTVATTTRFFLTTTTPKRTTSLSTKNLVPITPIQTTTTISWFFYLSPESKKINNITLNKINRPATGITTRRLSRTTSKTVTGAYTKTIYKTTVTNTPTENLYFEARLNKIRPENPTIGTLAYPIVFQDLTMKRNGLQKDTESEVIDAIITTTEPTETEVDLIDKREKVRNSLREKETIEYRELATEPFSKFLELLMQQLADMDSTNAAKFLRTFERQMGVLISSGGLDALGPATNAYILDAFRGFQFPVDHKQRLLSMAHNILANRNDILSPELNSLLDYLDMLYAEKSEVHMERVLNETKAYPNISKTAEEITEGFIEDVLLNPLKRLSGTTQWNKLLGAIADIISNKKSNLNARRVFSEKYYQYPKRHKKGKSVHNVRTTERERANKVFVNNYNKRLFSNEYGWIQTTKRTQKDRNRMTIVYRNRDGNINNFLYNSDLEDKEVKGTTKNHIKIYSLNFLNRAHEIPKDKRKLTAESINSNSGEKIFRASYKNSRRNKIVNNPFRTLLYKKNKDRFEKSDTDKETYDPYFKRTTPSTKATTQSVTLTTSLYKNKENYTFGMQLPTHESNMLHKQKVKYNKKVNEEKIKKNLRQSVKNEPNGSGYHEAESKESGITTTTTPHVSKPNKVKKVKLTKMSPKLSKSIDTEKNKTTRDTETTQSEFKKGNISLKHLYFKPGIMQNESGNDGGFISIEFDGEPNVIDFSMKVKLKKPITQPTTRKESDFHSTDKSETTTSPSTNALRVLNPYKMDYYFKTNETKQDKYRTANDKESSTDSDSSSDDSEKSDVSSEEGTDSQPHVFGKLRRIENREHIKQKLRSKKHGQSKKHHHERKHEKYKGHHRHGKHGKKRRHKFLQAYLKKNSHGIKKRIKHKLKHLKDKRILGKNFEIAFDSSSDDSEEKNLIYVTIIKRAKDGKRATISLVNKGEKFSSSHSSISSEEEKIKHPTTKRGEKSSMSTDHIKHKNQQRTHTTKSPLEVEATGESVNQKDHNTEDINQEDDHPELIPVNNDNNHQVMANEPILSTEENLEVTLPKDTIINKMTGPKVNALRKLLRKANKNRKIKKLSPMLIPINKSNRVANRVKSYRNVINKVTAQRRYFPIQIFNNSEYSDEEDELKRNLYDAFRHKDELYYRRNIRHELPLNLELREESDDTDEEIIFKENIYKAIKDNNRRNNHNRK